MRQKPGNFEGILMIFSVFEGFALPRLPIITNVWSLDLMDAVLFISALITF
jgi:hypothetical protein